MPTGGIDIQKWQAPLETEGDPPVSMKSFFHSIFFDREPFEAWVIPPQWTRGLIIVRGYASMMGPFPFELEAPVNFQGSFKISGKPMLLRGAVVSDPDTEVVLPSGADDPPVRYRAVANDLLSEFWTDAVAMGDTLAWGEGHSVTAMDFKYYKYTEDAGFGTAF